MSVPVRHHLSALYRMRRSRPTSRTALLNVTTVEFARAVRRCPHAGLSKPYQTSGKGHALRLQRGTCSASAASSLPTTAWSTTHQMATGQSFNYASFDANEDELLGCVYIGPRAQLGPPAPRSHGVSDAFRARNPRPFSARRT